MRVSAFTFCRDAIRFDYPVVESIRSLLPIVDEYVVNVGQSDDGTLDLIRSIGDRRIRIIETVWDEHMRTGGLVYSYQTNLALAECSGDWAFYLQADEVVHEHDLPVIRAGMERLAGDREVLGLLLSFRHFKGDYHSIDPWMYRHEIRIVRPGGRVRSFGDAAGFQRTDSGAPRSLRIDRPHRRRIAGRIFHYGWVKDPATMTQKKRSQISHYHGHGANVPANERTFFEHDRHDFDGYDVLKEFRGTHPAVMAARVAAHPRLRARRNRWLNWRFYREVARRGFKG